MQLTWNYLLRMSSRIENDENVNPTSANLEIFHDAQRFSVRAFYIFILYDLKDNNDAWR